jgi:chemotaxis response regulator CheB
MNKRPLSVIYVENDPALRGLFTSVLKSKPAIAEVYDFQTGEEAIAFGSNFLANVALLDVSLGTFIHCIQCQRTYKMHIQGLIKPS